MTLPDVAAIFEQHRTPILAGGAGAAVLLGLRARGRRKAAPATGVATGGAASGVTTTAAYAGRGGVYDSTANDVYNSIQPQISSLAGQLAELSNGIGATRLSDEQMRGALSNPNLQPGQTSGSGIYNPGVTRDSTGQHSYGYIPSQPTAANILAGGGTLYFEPLPGIFTDANAPGVHLESGQYGTPLYARTA